MMIELSDKKTRSFEIRLFQADFKSYGDDFEGLPDDGGILVHGEVKRNGDTDAKLAFTVEGTMLYPCARCLELTPIDCVFEFDDVVELEETGTIDLVPFVEECLFVNEPFRVLCDEECKGLCPGCGVNLNHEVCQCEETDDIDPRLEALRKLL